MLDMRVLEEAHKEEARFAATALRLPLRLRLGRPTSSSSFDRMSEGKETGRFPAFALTKTCTILPKAAKLPSSLKIPICQERLLLPSFATLSPTVTTSGYLTEALKSQDELTINACTSPPILSPPLVTLIELLSRRERAPLKSEASPLDQPVIDNCVHVFVIDSVVNMRVLVIILPEMIDTL